MKVIKILLGLALSATLLVSCNYLDVIPPEQANLKDATKTNQSTLGFLYSCYAGVGTPMGQYSAMESGADEWVLPPLWNEFHHRLTRDLETPANIVDWRWGHYYRYIGQCHLFTRELDNATNVSEAEKREWLAEVDFLLGYYHMQMLTQYGPIPITDSYIPMNTDPSEYNGRFHFDYVVDWIVEKFDAAAAVLPATRSGEAWGRATSTIAKALKARLLVYAASPLWNGRFPYPDWKNTKFETPGYGFELVSKQYDPKKWERAQQAAEEALTFALQNGYQLYNDTEKNDRDGVPLPFVPGVDPNTQAGEEFLEKVMVMRYAVATRVNEGNDEIIWGHSSQGNWIYGILPHFIQKHNNGSNIGLYSGVSPLLNTTVQYFYTINGKRPAHDSQFFPETDWYKSAGVPNRGDIIRLNLFREPRFYAWLAFDGGDMGSKVANGNPIKLEIRNRDKQGLNLTTSPRDNNVTGYFTQKFLPPKFMINLNGNWVDNESKPRPIIRLAELYLNLAECYAALNNTGKALENLNVIRERAGVPALTTADIGSPMSLMEWVQNERFIELWGEGHRYYDVRRWMIAPETMGEGKRTGLNAYQMENPSFEVFNTPTPVNQPYRWTPRMYLRPVFHIEVYKNPQLVQAPGY